MGRGRTGLYVVVVCFDPDMANLAGKERDHDGPIWRDDFVELFIDTNFDRLTYTHLAVSAFGTTYDAANRDGKWEGHWLSRSRAPKITGRSRSSSPGPTSAVPGQRTRWGFDIARRRPAVRPSPSTPSGPPPFATTRTFPDASAFSSFLTPGGAHVSDLPESIQAIRSLRALRFEQFRSHGHWASFVLATVQGPSRRSTRSSGQRQSSRGHTRGGVPQLGS